MFIAERETLLMLTKAMTLVVWVKDGDEPERFGIINTYGHNEAEIERVVSHCKKRCDRVEVGVSDDVVHSLVKSTKKGR